MNKEVDIVENGAIVKVFLLEAPLPSNAGDEILSAAGPFWEGYALTHAALGFVVEESQAKHVLELFARDYVGSFLPDLPPLPPTPTPTPSPSTDAPAGVKTSSPTAPAPAPSGTASPTAAPTSLDILTPDSGNTSSSSSSSPTTPGGNESSDLVSEGWRDGEAASDFRKDVRGGGGSGNGTAGGLTWGNDATLLPTSGFDPNKWATANYVGKITGLLFNDLSGWANSYREKNPRYQPLSACGGDADSPDGGDFSTKGSADSYDFVWAAFGRLASNGFIFEQQVVLPPRRTVMCIFPEGGVEAVDYVEAEGNQEIEDYFRATGDCVRNLAAAAAAGNATYPGAACASDSGDGWAAEGGVSVLLGISNCLDGQSNAYLYHNETSYLRLPLPASADGNGTLAATAAAASAAPHHAAGTARLVRYASALPQPPPSPPAGSDRAYIVYIAVGVAVIGLAIAGLSAFYRRRKEDGRAWRGGGFGEGSAAPDFGDFDSVGGGYEGALFPADNYSSGGLSGSRSFGAGVGGRVGNWRGGRSHSETGPLEAETVQLKRPLLNEADVDSGEASSRRSFSGGGGGRSDDPRSDARRQGDGGRGRARGGGIATSRVRSSGQAESSPPPFSRILGTMGGGPSLSDGKSNTPRRSEGGARERGRGAGGKDDRGLDGKPLREDEDDDAGDDPFATGGGGSGKTGSLRKDDGPEGDEVFC